MIRWIDPTIGTAAANAVAAEDGLAIVDVRDLVDKAGNKPEVIRQKIDAGVRALAAGHRVVVCCDYGMSRSNAVAAGVIALSRGIPFLSAVGIVQKVTGETEIKLEPLRAVRAALEGKPAARAMAAKPVVLVTGSRGFLGASVVAALAAEANVVQLSRDQMDLELGCTQLSLLAQEHAVDTIIHLANPRIFTSNAAIGRTLTMLRNVIDVCLASDIHLIYPSGWEVYSGYSGNLLADESVPVLVRGPYGEAKMLAEMMIEHCVKTAGLRCGILRSSPVYGVGSDRPKFIHNFIAKALRNEKIITHRYRNGDPALDLLHVSDLVEAVRKALLSRHAGAVNIGTGSMLTTPEIARIICRVCESTSEIGYNEVDTYTANISMNAGLAARQLGWAPLVASRDGIAKVVAEKLSIKGGFA